MKLIECIPNFSEGRDTAIIERIADSIKSVDGVNLLHTDIGYDANRSVMTFVGSPDGVVEAAFRAIQCAGELIDMRKQKGEHPRIGATDVCPLVPISEVNMEEVVELSVILAERVYNELSIPVFLYEKSANNESRRKLEHIRKGEYEGLAGRMENDGYKADYGTNKFNYTTGCTVIGARDFLIAFNVNLSTKSTAIAKEIACRIRESGSTSLSAEKLLRLKGLKAIAWYIEEYKCLQVSTNITDTSVLTLFDVYESIRILAKEYETDVSGSELIGLLPLKVILDSGKKYAEKEQVTATSTEQLISLAIQKLGLNSVVPFNPQERILDLLCSSLSIRTPK
ncbi:MAG: glutamate formimidoyltransferase [Bacteroidales bacterium]